MDSPACSSCGRQPPCSCMLQYAPAAFPTSYTSQPHPPTPQWSTSTPALSSNPFASTSLGFIASHPLAMPTVTSSHPAVKFSIVDPAVFQHGQQLLPPSLPRSPLRDIQPPTMASGKRKRASTKNRLKKRSATESAPTTQANQQPDPPIEISSPILSSVSPILGATPTTTATSHPAVAHPAIRRAPGPHINCSSLLQENSGSKQLRTAATDIWYFVRGCTSDDSAQSFIGKDEPTLVQPNKKLFPVLACRLCL